ncbi:MAG: cation diffusion facilitator family transporter [Polaromonas sp.]|nr:cation diffusion facilitator family transporter [Polaromonas sp.]
MTSRPLSVERHFTPLVLMKVSIVVALLTITMKAGAWYITDSVGLLSDAMESFVNLASAVFGLAMVTIAARPADADHPFGHHKAEYFSSGFEGVLIVGAAAAIIWASLHRVFNPRPLQQVGWGLALSIISSLLNGLLAWAMFRAARRHRSIALDADARHLLTDVWTSAGVVVGIAAVALTGWLWLDAAVAAAVGANILWEGGKLIWRSSQGLMDEALEPEVLAQIDAVLLRFRNAGGRGVRIDHVATRRGGQRRFIDLHLHVPGNWTLARAAQLRGDVEAAFFDQIPGLHASIQLLPDDVEPLAEEALGAASTLP